MDPVLTGCFTLIYSSMYFCYMLYVQLYDIYIYIDITYEDIRSFCMAPQLCGLYTAAPS